MQAPETLPSDIREYLEAENAYYEQQMADTAKLQKKLFTELKGRIKEAAGALTGNDKLRAEGKADQAVGKVKQVAEKAVEKVKQAA